VASYVAPISWGLGDLIVSLPVIQGLIARGEETYLVTRSYLQEGLGDRILGLAGTVPENEFDASTLGENDRYYNLREHPLQTDYWWGTPEFEQLFADHTINDLLAIIAKDLGLRADFDRLQKLDYQGRPDAMGSTILIAGSDGDYKCWGTNNWLSLISKLKSTGFKPIVVGQPEKSPAVKALIDAGTKWIETRTLTDALDVISCAVCAIGVDTGLMHMAVQQHVPTVTLYRNRPIYVRSYEYVAALTAKPCAQECIEKSFGCRTNDLTEFKAFVPQTWSCTLNETDRCLSSISPSNVMAVLHSVIKHDKRSAVGVGG